MRFTQKQKLEMFDNLYAQNQHNEIAMGDIVRGDVEWSPWVKEDAGDCEYRVGRVGAQRDCGGYMVVVMRCRKTGQRDSVSQAYLWEEHERLVRTSYTGSEYALIVSRCIAAMKLNQIRASLRKTA